MVCVPCIVIPFFLFIWHKFLQPIFLRMWNPWGKVEDKPKEGEEDSVTSLEGKSIEKADPSVDSSSGIRSNAETEHSKAD